ncbi:MAG TPA: MucR family transcriptional regulator [Syntrophobacteraceae bacterium]|nr:MucR family transcriptional regulator [Syntrophobacteraceae bacterium]
MPKKLIEIASEIVQYQASLTSMTAAEITSSLRQIFSTLHDLQRTESGEIELPTIQEPEPAQALSPKDSIRKDKVICLECGVEMKQLTQKHLAVHGMSPTEYKKKYGFPMKTSLAAKSVSRARSRAMKKKGLPEKLKLYLESRKQAKAEALKPIAPENSIQEDRIVCLECGAEFKQLTGKHLVSHGLAPNEYKKKYGFSMKTPLLAKSVIKAMKEARQKRGLPENLKRVIEAKKQQKDKASTPAATGTAMGVSPNRTKLRKKKA